MKIRGYQAQPLRRIYIPKKNGKQRPLSIPTMHDRAMQSLFRLALEPVSEVTADLNSYGFRPKRSAHDAIYQSYIVLASRNSAQWILDADIKACFDEISHDWLLDNILVDKRVLKQWLKSGYMDKGRLFETTRGTPQGGPASPLLANMVLNGLEETIKTQCGKGKKINFVRFADDFIVTASSKDILEEEVKPIINSFLQTRGLSLSKEKTRIVNIEEGFDFLGFNVRKYKGKFLTKPSKDSVKSIKKKIKDQVKEGYGWSGKDLIAKLNPIIKGWANYYRHVVAKETFSEVDDYIFRKTLYWTMRKFNGHQRYKAVNKYYRSRHLFRRWIFSDVKANKNGKKEYICLHKMMDVKIQRHIKIRAVATPYLSEFKEYFKDRKRLMGKISLIQRRMDKFRNSIWDGNELPDYWS